MRMGMGMARERERESEREKNVNFTFPNHVHATNYMIEEECDTRAPMVCR